MIELFPTGFEEIDYAGGEVELAAYTDAGGEERLWHAFGGTRSATDVEEGWEERWRAFHQPVHAGGLWIGPPWETPPPGELTVVIDPGRAFGTGGHATTRLCIELLAATRPGSLVDVGCGSGVLSIAAARLGFGPILGLDNEEPAVEATLENARVNGVEVEARLGDVLGTPLPEADAVVANITLPAVNTLAPYLRSDRIVTSGYLESEHPELPGFRHLDRRTAEGWAADLHER